MFFNFFLFKLLKMFFCSPKRNSCAQRTFVWGSPLTQLESKSTSADEDMFAMCVCVCRGGPLDENDDNKTILNSDDDDSTSH